MSMQVGRSKADTTFTNMFKICGALQALLDGQSESRRERVVLAPRQWNLYTALGQTSRWW